jgi:arylsulfatase A-like enzyme
MAQPNIVFIMADDMGYGDLGCYGAERIPTPNIDRLAAEGMLFTDAHSSSAVCSPSRYSVLTGRYCWRTWLDHGVLAGFGAPLVEPGRMTVASLLKEAGYATGAFGKWHLGLDWRTKSGDRVSDIDDKVAWDYEGLDADYEEPFGGGPTELGFDCFFGIAGSLDMPPYCFLEDDHCVGPVRGEKDVYLNQQRRGMMADGWRDDLVDVTFAEKACAFIEEQAAAARPFFAYLPLSAPHRPCVPPDFLEGRSQAGDRGDMVCALDWCTGQVMEKLDEFGVAENTLLIVTSDNGARLACANGRDYGHKSNGELRGQKADIWEGGHREPFVARWPGRVEAGAVCDDLICLGDLMATCAEMVEADLPEGAGEDSISFFPSLLGAGKRETARRQLVHHSAAGMFSIRQGRWKLVEGLGSGGFSEPTSARPEEGGPEGQLYDMEADVAEGHDLYLKRPDIVERLRRALGDRRRADAGS